MRLNLFLKQVKVKVVLIGLMSALIVACSPGAQTGYEVRLDNVTRNLISIGMINEQGGLNILCEAFSGSKAKVTGELLEGAIEVEVISGNCKGTSGFVAVGVITVI